MWPVPRHTRHKSTGACVSDVSPCQHLHTSVRSVSLQPLCCLTPRLVCVCVCVWTDGPGQRARALAAQIPLCPAAAWGRSHLGAVLHTSVLLTYSKPHRQQWQRGSSLKKLNIKWPETGWDWPSGAVSPPRGDQTSCTVYIKLACQLCTGVFWGCTFIMFISQQQTDCETGWV